MIRARIIIRFFVGAQYVLSKRFFLKREGLSNTRVASITKKEYGSAVHFL